MSKPRNPITSDPWRDQLARLTIFEAVARALSFTNAARSLGLSQPSVSRAVAALEAHLGTPLIERHGRTLRLTPAGESTFASAQRMRDELDHLAAQLGRDRTPRGDFLCFAAEHVASHMLAAATAALTRRYPLLLPRVVTGPAHHAVEEVAAGRAEVGFYFWVEPHAHVEARPLASFPCRLVCHPDAVTDERVLTSFIGSRELENRRSTAFPTLEMLQRHRPKTRIKYSSNSLALHEKWVREKVGISILPNFLIDERIARKELCILHRDWVYSADLFAIVRRGRTASSPTRELLKEVRLACRAIGGKVLRSSGVSGR